MNVFITASVSGVVMIQLQAAYPGARWPLVVAIAVAIVVYMWLVFSHKLRSYIQKWSSK